MISSYELYKSKDDESTHPAFGNSSFAEGNVQFEMNENRIDNLTYYLKVTADGGEIYWSEEKVFTTECGLESA